MKNKKLKIVQLLSSINYSDEAKVALSLAKYFENQHNHIVEFVCWNKQINEVLHSNDYKLTYVSKNNVAQYIRKNNYDIVINHYSSLKSHLEFLETLYSTISTPIILVNHESYLYPLFSGYEYIIRLRAEFYKNIAAVVSTTEFTLSCFKENDKLSNIVTINSPCPYNNTIISRLNSKNIVSMADWNKQANNLEGHVETFSLILKKIPNAKWHIVGRIQQNNLTQLLNKHNIPTNSVIVYNITTKQEEILLNSSVCLTIPHIDGIPLSILGAKTYGLPVVANKIAGFDDIIDNNINGYLVERNNYEQAADHVVNLLQNTNLRRKLGKSALQHSKSFSLENIGAKWDNLLEIVLSNNKEEVASLSDSLYNIYQEKEDKISLQQEEYSIRCIIEKPTNKDNYILYFLLFSINTYSNIQADYTEKNVITKLLGLFPIVKYNVLIANNNISKRLTILGITIYKKQSKL